MECRSAPVRSTNGERTGIASVSRATVRIVDVAGECTRIDSRTTFSRYGRRASASSSAGVGAPSAAAGVAENASSSARSLRWALGFRVSAYSVQESAFDVVSCPAAMNVEIWQSVSFSLSR